MILSDIELIQKKNPPLGWREGGKTVDGLLKKKRIAKRSVWTKGKTVENKNLIAALIKAQAQMRPPVKDGNNPAFKSKYATLDSIYSACRKPLSENGLALSHSVDADEGGRYFLITTLYHVSGETMQNKFPMFIERQTNQGMASARTYACRYATCSLLAIPGDDDDDGNSASLTYEQQKELENLIGGDDALADRVLKGYERKYKKPVTSFKDIKQADFVPAINALKSNPKPIQKTL